MTDAAGTNDIEELKEKLSAYPKALAERVLKFHQTPEESIAAEIVIEILRYHQPEEFEKHYADKGDAIILIDDLGMDSLTMTEIAFEAEDFLDITIANEDMIAIKTVADLKAFVFKAIP